MMQRAGHSALVSYVSLFGSVGTLLCCALPSMLVLLGLGTTVAAALSAAPWLLELSRHKSIVFTVSGLLIAANLVYVYRLSPMLRARQLGCDVSDPRACADASAPSRVILWFSAGLYATGFFVAFALGPIFTRFAE
jgi:hypothetical protein